MRGVGGTGMQTKGQRVFATIVVVYGRSILYRLPPPESPPGILQEYIYFEAKHTFDRRLRKNTCGNRAKLNERGPKTTFINKQMCCSTKKPNTSQQTRALLNNKTCFSSGIRASQQEHNSQQQRTSQPKPALLNNTSAFPDQTHFSTQGNARQQNTNLFPNRRRTGQHQPRTSQQ